MENENTIYTSGDSNQQSLLTALNRFVQAVNTMDDTVMIPCRLRDMEVKEKPEVTVENNNKAAVKTLPVGADLFSFYSMLNAIKEEIITGPATGSNEENVKESEGGETDENNSRKTAAAFRHHLRGLFDLLHNLTETARYLSSRYENDVSQTSSVSSFAL